MVSRLDEDDHLYNVSVLQASITEIIESNALIGQNDRASLEIIKNLHEKLICLVVDTVLLEQADTKSRLGPNDNCSQSIQIFDDIWVKIQKPLFDWFRDWKYAISKKKRRKATVERRVLFQKYTKLFKITHKFYYRILEKLVSSVDVRKFLPTRIINDLNLQHLIEKGGKSARVLQSNDQTSMVYLRTVYECLFYLGKIHYWFVLLKGGEDAIKNTQIQKSSRYLNLARILLPSEPKTYAQLALLYIKTGDRISAAYFSMRAGSCGTYFKSYSYLFGKTLNQTKRPSNYFEKGLLETSDTQTLFLNLLKGFYDNDSSISDTRKHMMSVFLLKLKEMLSDEKDDYLAVRIVGIIIGCFHEILRRDNVDIKCLRMDSLDQKYDNYLQWAVATLSKIISVLMDKSFVKKYEKPGYLASVRLIMCWIKSHKVILQFTHRNSAFCQQLAESVNNFSEFDVYGTDLYVKHRPKRPYLFEEDILLRGFTCIDYMLSDFNDNDILNDQQSADNAYGRKLEEKALDAYSENLLRLTAIISAILKFLGRGMHGISWNGKTKMFEIEKMRSNLVENSYPLWEIVNHAKKESPSKKELSINELSKLMSPTKKAALNRTIPLTSIARLSRESISIQHLGKKEDTDFSRFEQNTSDMLVADGIDVSLDLSSIHDSGITSSQSMASVQAQIITSDDVDMVDFTRGVLDNAEL